MKINNDRIKKIAKQGMTLVLALAVAVSGMQKPVDAGTTEQKHQNVTTQTTDNIKNQTEQTEDGAKNTGANTVQKTDAEGKAEPVVVKELKKERTENSNTYLLNNGMKKTEYYSDSIRFKDENGKLEEYNPKLVDIDESSMEEIAESADVSKKNAAGYAYENKSGDTKQYLPKVLGSDTPVLLVNGNYRVSFAPVEKKEDEYEENNSVKNFFKHTGGVVKETASDAQEDKEYSDVKADYVDSERGITLSYESLDHGIKEEIILEEIPETNVFSFEMTLENMIARLDDVGGGISFMVVPSEL